MASPSLWRRPLVVILLGAAAGCSSPAGPGQQILPGATGGTGGTIIGGTGGGGGGLHFGDSGILPAPDAGITDAAATGGSGGSTPDAGPGSTGGGGGMAAVGDKCTTSASCPRGGVCAADVAGGGYCTADCTTAGTCPAGASCVAATDTTKICIKTCALPTHCRAEHICLSGLCLPKCTKGDDCDSGNCDVASGRCGPSRVGNACTADTDCGQAPSFCDKSRPGGYCSTPCGGPMNVECPAEANCVSGGGGGTCLKTCAAGADCRSGFLCVVDSGGTRSCMPGCQQNSDCAAGLRCETATGACVMPPPGSVGGTCTGALGCAALGTTAFCATDADGFPGGYCSAACENTPCLAPGLCVAFSATESNCLSPCTAPAECRAGYTCFALKSGTGGVCLPKCTSDADCSDPSPVCDLATGYCAVRPTGGPGTSDVVNLTPNGPITVGGLFATDRLIVTLPADAVSVNFVGEAIPDPTSRVSVQRLEQSTDDFTTATRLFDAGSISNLVQVAPSLVLGAFSVLYPNSPTAPFMPSTKVAIRLTATKATTVNVTAILKRAPSAVLTQGQIDLNLFFVGLPALNATSAPNDARFKQIFDQVKSTWAKVGVTVGTVNYIDIVGADGARFSDLDEQDLGPLMTRSRTGAAKDNALNVFFVHTISGDTLSGYIILGVAAGLPGAPIRGTTASGLAVTTADFPMGLGEIAQTWAHEGGHALGLFHTTELGGTAFDPLPDTAECARTQRDANNDKVLQPAECQGFGADNLMFWTGGAVPNTNLTPNQGFVLLRNPALH